MNPVADVIVLSSSPDRGHAHTPASVIDTENPLPLPLRCQSSSPIPSPSELLRPLSRSRFFATEERKESDGLLPSAPNTIVNGGPEKNPETVVSNAPPLENKQKRGVRKPKNGPQTVLRDVDSAVLKTKENAPTKPKRTRKKRVDGGAQREKITNKTITGKIAKSALTTSEEPNPKAVDKQSTSRPSCGKRNTKEVVNEWENDGLQLELALKRRLDWTPTKNTTKSVIDLDDNEGAEAGYTRLGSLASEYGYNGALNSWKEPQTLDTNGPTKRRRIELVDSRIVPPQPNQGDIKRNQSSEEEAHSSASSKLEKKPKKRAKKITTLTGRVTASYATESMGDSESPGEDSATAKSRSRVSKKKITANSEFKMPRSILLSPEAAVKSLEDQDLVFGTCSQLQLDDSPPLLRETQVAVRESERQLSPTIRSRSSKGTKLGRSSATTISRFTAPRSLWSVAARDADGLLVEAEVLDLVDIPETSTATIPKNDKNNTDDDNENELEEVNDDNTKLDMPRADAPADLPAASEIEPTDSGLPPSDAQAAKTAGRKLKSTSNHPMPHYSGFTDTELAKQIKRYGLKAIKSRKKMIEVLEKCWVAKHGPTNQEEGEDSPNIQPTPDLEPAPQPRKAEKKARKARAPSQKTAKSQSKSSTKPDKDKDLSAAVTAGEPSASTSQIIQTRKSNFTAQSQSSQPSTRSFIDVDEIQDSEEELVPSPSRLQTQYLLQHTEYKQALPTLNMSQRVSRGSSQSQHEPLISNPAANNTGTILDLGEQITKAVRAQPRQNSASSHHQPSWHEKILMYDPIFLEDFTSWLNTDGLGLVNEDREVDAGFVRRWCESKGICCCYKVRKTAGHY